LASRLFSRRWVVLLALLSIALFFTGCYPSHPQSLFDPKGPVSANQLTLFYVIFWAAVAVFVIVIGVFGLTLIKFRARSGQSDRPVQVHGNRTLEIAWTVAPALLLAAIAVMTIRTIFELNEPPSDDPMQINVMAHQWWWEIDYPGFDITTANEIVVPVQRDISFTLDSNDVIHSFWVPKLAGKQDIIPNKTNKTWFNADEPGVYQGVCAEFCGIAHALMRFHVKAVSQEEFDHWLASQQSAPATRTGEGAAGQQVFLAKGCILCHSISGPDTDDLRQGRTQAFLDGEAEWTEGQPNQTHGPNLTHFASRSHLAGGILENTEENLKLWLEDPEKMKPGNRMSRLGAAFNHPDASTKLTTEDIDLLIEYLLPSAELAAAGNSDKGTASERSPELLLTEVGCGSCHTLDGVGGMNGAVGPSLTGLGIRAGTRNPDLSSEEYIRESIEMPGAYVVDGFSNLMPSLRDSMTDKELDNLVEYLRDLE